MDCAKFANGSGCCENRVSPAAIGRALATRAWRGASRAGVDDQTVPTKVFGGQTILRHAGGVPPTLRYSVPVLLALALVTAVGYGLVSAPSRSWFEYDIKLRAGLAVRGARQGLVDHWAKNDRR